MTTSSRLQYVTGELVRTRKFQGIEYAAGKSMVYGATCPGRDVALTIAAPLDPAKVCDLLIYRPRCPYLWIAFTRVSLTGMGTQHVDILVNGNSVKNMSGASFGGLNWVHRHNANPAVFPIMNQTNVRVGIQVDGVQAGTLTIRDLIVAGSYSTAFPPWATGSAAAVPDSTS